MVDQLRVNPAACDGVGICAHLAADLIRVDTWGFPIVSGEALRSDTLRSGAPRSDTLRSGTPRSDTLRQARAAVAACPRRALFIEAGIEAVVVGHQPGAG